VHEGVASSSSKLFIKKLSMRSLSLVGYQRSNMAMKGCLFLLALVIFDGVSFSILFSNKIKENNGS
jgi:hypothetical protein